MISWLELFNASRSEEWGGAPVIGALATLGGHVPYVRHVVVRRVEEDGALLFTSHRDSGKNQQLRENPAAELALWLPRLRQQFRFAGHLSLLQAAEATTIQAIWRQLSEPTRLTFVWPKPGDSRAAAEAFAISLPPEAPIPVTFEVLRLIPRQIELLELLPVVHRRRQWVAEHQWMQEELNP